MATSQDIKNAADAVVSAKTSYAASESAYGAAQAEVIGLVTVEQSALDAAAQAYNEAFTAAALTVPEYATSSESLSAAGTALSTALAALQEAIDSYDGT